MRLVGTVIAIAGCLAAGCAAGQPKTYPSQTVTIVVPFGPGSGLDTVARVIAADLSERLNARVIVENKPGASGALAASHVAHAAPDGHTLMFTSNTTHSANPSLLPSISYDPIRDFAPIARLGSLPSFLVAHPSVPARTLGELVAYGTSHPGKLSYATGNATGVVAGATLALRTGIEMLRVPYNSTPQGLNDLIGGRVPLMITDFATGIPHVQSGAIRAVAMTSGERSRLLPDMPTFAESGLPDFDVTAWQGAFAPAGTPKEIVDLLNAEICRSVENPVRKAHFASIGFDARCSSPADFEAFVKDELVKWTRLIADAGLKPR